MKICTAIIFCSADSGGEWRLATILDFDKAWAGHAETDLARLEFWKGMTSPAFLGGVSPVEPLDADYLQRRPIYQLLWCLEYAPSTPQHLADTRRVFHELGIPVVETCLIGSDIPLQDIYPKLPNKLA